jgi:GNAT superfamily N-acetyltransferase
MNITRHQYDRDTDYDRVNQFLLDTYKPGKYHDNWLQPRWEYMHYHPSLDKKALNKIGIWESGGKIVAVANYELNPGETFFQVHPDFASLKSEMLEYAEANLFETTPEGRRRIAVFVNDFDKELIAIVKQRGYQLATDYRDTWSEIEMRRSFPVKLPSGFHLQSLEEEDDIVKLSRLIYRGFNHPGEPPEGSAEGIRHMQDAPNYRKDLNILAVTENDNYVSYSGVWLDRNKVVYIEPVCTDPDYRRLGLGTATLFECLNRCIKEDTKAIQIGSEQPFYKSMGVNVLHYINLWTKNLS